jgi:hypothetical protein
MADGELRMADGEYGMPTAELIPRLTTFRIPRSAFSHRYPASRSTRHS